MNLRDSLVANIVGYMGVVIGISLMLPQVVKSWKTKRADDLSLGMVVLYFFNCIAWGVYGFLEQTWPAVVVNAICTVIAIVQIILKVRYTRAGTASV